METKNKETPQKSTKPVRSTVRKTTMKKEPKKMTGGYAIFQTGGKQYQAVEGKTLSIEKIVGEPGAAIEFTDVLLRKLPDGTVEIGRPHLEGIIKASIIKHIKEPKKIIFKFKRRKKSRVKKGHRQPKTVIRIESI